MRLGIPGYVALFAFAAAGTGYGQTISTIAGTSNCCTSTDGSPGTSAWLLGLGGITQDAKGNLYFWSGQKIRMLSPSGTITTTVGSGNVNVSLNSGPAAGINLGACQPY